MKALTEENAFNALNCLKCLKFKKIFTKSKKFECQWHKD